MTDKFDKALDEVLHKYFMDGYKQGFKDGYKEADAETMRQLELPQPKAKAGDKISITLRTFKCTSCSGSWKNSEDAKHHSCKDYQ